MKYTVQSPLKHNGKDYEIGASVELSNEDAPPLLAAKPPVIELAQSDSAATLTAPESLEERTAAIRAAIEVMDKADPALWLKDGTTPDTKALTTLVGWPVTAADRAAALKAE